jgi:hypothetical protein
MWIARLWQGHAPNTCIISNGFAAMGIGVPGAIAAKLAYPGRRVVTITGDARFLMNSQEIETALRLGLAFVILVWTDKQYGLIKWHQDKRFGRPSHIDFENPDLVRYAESFGARGFRVELVDAHVVEAALAVAQGLFEDRAAWLPADRRIAVLNRAADLLSERADAFATDAAREGGKPLIDSQVEVARAVDVLRNCAELLRAEAGVEVPMGVTPASRQRLAFTHPEPIGIVVAVSAFNHPLNLIVHQVGRAVAAGCPVVVKPAEATPLSIDAALTRANALRTALQAAVFTRDIDVALDAASSLSASALMINDHTAIPCRLDAVRGAQAVGPRGRRHPSHLPGYANGKADRHAFTAALTRRMSAHPA